MKNNMEKLRDYLNASKECYDTFSVPFCYFGVGDVTYVYIADTVTEIRFFENYGKFLFKTALTTQEMPSFNLCPYDFECVELVRVMEYITNLYKGYFDAQEVNA